MSFDLIGEIFGVQRAKIICYSPLRNEVGEIVTATNTPIGLLNHQIFLIFNNHNTVLTIHVRSILSCKISLKVEIVSQINTVQPFLLYRLRLLLLCACAK